MNRQLKRMIGLSWLFILSLSVTQNCQSLTLEEEQKTVLSDKTYSINSATLLHSLASGNERAFVLETGTPKANQFTSPSPIQWKQVDYLYVVQAFHQFAEGESLKEWNLKEMFFRLNCEDASLGPQFASFVYFKTMRVQNESSRLVRDLYIDPRENRVDLLEVDYHPELTQWPSIDLALIKVTAEQALDIAESNGGTEIRRGNGDNCIIYEHIDAGSTYSGVLAYDGWIVSYLSDDRGAPLLRININASTGENKIIR